MKIIKVAGTNGSGKTTLARALCGELGGMKPVERSERGKVLAYKLNPPTGYKEAIILGPYETVCGGMDAVSGKELRLSLVKKYTRQGTLLIFEGLIVGKCFGAIGEWSLQHPEAWVYTFMDTPFDICVERVLARRAVRRAHYAEKKGRPLEPDTFDPQRTLQHSYDRCIWVRNTAKEYGLRTYMVNHKSKPEKAAAKLLRDVL